jgi:hypothetical protein
MLLGSTNRNLDFISKSPLFDRHLPDNYSYSGELRRGDRGPKQFPAIIEGVGEAKIRMRSPLQYCSQHATRN